ncbi:MAG TPA: MaoC family dehydratase [Steroidobacteraceae bacterium]|nr:MaoC family dehydratase [Steroidobacteraceae bacterium]
MKGPVRSAELQELQALVGKELGTSQWVTIGQDLVDRFADLTDDHQPIHVDPVAAAHTSWGGTIAHGFLALSLISNFAYQVVPQIRGTSASLNYGFNRIRFTAPVPSGARIRGRFTLLSIEPRRDGSLNLTCNVTVEIEGRDRPALVAEWITTALFNQHQTE